MIESIAVKTEKGLKIPSIPNFINSKTESIPIEDIPKEELIRIAEAWTSNLLEKAGY